MKHCADPTCPFVSRYGRAAEYGDGVSSCVDCGATLSDGPAPKPARSASEASLPAASRALWLRAAVTFAVVALTLALHYLPLPSAGAYAPTGLSGLPGGLLAVGLGPLILGFGVVELVAALVPPLRATRYSGPQGRRRLTQMALATGLALTLIVTTTTVSALEYALDLDRRLLALLLTSAPLVLYLASRVVDRFGIGGGLPVIVASLVGADLVRHIIAVATLGTDLIPAAELGLLLAVLTLVVPISGSCRPAEAQPRWLRRVLPADGPTLPLSGGAPLADLMLPITVASPLLLFFGLWIDLPSFLYPVPPMAAYIVTVGVAALVVGWLYHQPRRVIAVQRALGQSARADDDATRRTLRRALAATVLILVAAAWLWSLAAVRNPAVPPLAPLALIAVVGLDLAAEWRARRALGPVARAWCLHRTYAVAPVMSALEREGIDAFARSRRLRALLPFLASWAPMDILVRPADVERARAFLATRLGAVGRLSREAILDALS